MKAGREYPGEKAGLFLPNQTVKLPLVPSVSDAKFNQGHITFWGNGGDTLFEIGSLTDNRDEEVFGLSVISVSELLHGVHRADSTKRRLKRSAFVEKIIELFPIYGFDMSVARIYAEVWSDLSKNGIQIGAHDLIIGSTALSKGFSVATFNIRHFERIEGLKLEVLAFQK